MKHRLRISFGGLFVALIAAGCTQQPGTESPESTSPRLSPAAEAEAPLEAQDRAPLPGLSLAWNSVEVGPGIKPALALDRDGVVHIAFLTEEQHGSVSYGSNAGGEFGIEVVAEGYFYGPLDVALSTEGAPHIAYHDHQDTGFRPELGDEVIAVLKGGAWELTTVEDAGHDGWDNSIVVDREGNWHTASIDPAQFGSQSGVEYATNGAGSVGQAEVGSGPVNYEFGTSIQLGSDGSPGVTYYNSTRRQLEYASLGPAGWTVEVVDGEGDAGRYSSLAYHPDGTPHVSYYVALTGTSGVVRHAWREGDAWQVEDVDSLGDIQMGMVGARKITALVIAPDGTPHLAYTDRSRVLYGRRDESGWAVQVVATAGDNPLGQLVELDLGPDGNPHLIWYEVTSLSPALSGTVVYASGQ